MPKEVDCFLPLAQEKETPVTCRNVSILPVMLLKIRKTDGSIHAFPGTYSVTSACEVVSTMAGSFAVALADRNIAELVKHSTDTIQVGRDDLGLG